MDWDTLLRLASAVAWLVVLTRLLRRRRELNGSGLRRIVVTACLALILVVIAIGPTLAALYDGTLTKGLYTATATLLLLVGLAVASSPA